MDDVVTAATITGFAGGGTASLIFGLQRSCRNAIPGWGWFILGATAIAVIAAVHFGYAIRLKNLDSKKSSGCNSCGSMLAEYIK